MLRCALDCCFRMYEVPTNPNWLTDVFVGDELDDLADYAVCTATREAWEEETSGEPVEYGGEEYVGGVPVDCPIFQMEVMPPWEEASDWRAAEGILSPRADAPPPEEDVRRMREEWFGGEEA